jgi:5-methylcytosine-specific restriction endonuclease McrA
VPLRLCLGFRGQTCTKIVDGNRCAEHARLTEAARRPNRPNARQRGYTYQHERNRATILAASRTCWICGHDGADQADDVTPKSRGGSSTLANLRPAHGTKPCPTCGARCNQVRGGRDAHVG